MLHSILPAGFPSLLLHTGHEVLAAAGRAPGDGGRFVALRNIALVLAGCSAFYGLVFAHFIGLHPVALHRNGKPLLPA